MDDQVSASCGGASGDLIRLGRFNIDNGGIFKIAGLYLRPQREPTQSGNGDDLIVVVEFDNEPSAPLNARRLWLETVQLHSYRPLCKLWNFT